MNCVELLHMHLYATQLAWRGWVWLAPLLVEVPVWEAAEDSYRVSVCAFAYVYVWVFGPVCMHKLDSSTATVCLKPATETSIKHHLNSVPFSL